MTNTRYGYEQLIEDFGAQLRDAVSGRRARTQRRRNLGAGVVALGSAAATAVILSGIGDGGRLDSVAQAEAALAPAGSIVHLITSSREEMRGGAQAQIVGEEAELGDRRVSERWSTSAPLRWRTIETVPIVTAHGTLTGAVQRSFSGGTEQVYVQALNRLEITTGVLPESRRGIGVTEGPLTADPVTGIRAMLTSGRLKDAGPGAVDGQAVRRMTGYAPGSSLAPSAPEPVEYDVNPETYVPVRLSVEMPGVPVRGNTGTLTFVLDVERYEQLPLNDSTSRLLNVQTSGSPTVERHAASEPEH